MEDEVRGTLPGIAHKGECLQDPDGGPFCMLCGAFSGRVDADKVSRLDIDEWSQIQKYSKVLQITQLVIAFVPLIFILLDNIFGWTGLSFFDYKLPSRRGFNIGAKYIDLVTPMYLVFVSTMFIQWTYIDKEFLRIFRSYSPSKVFLLKMGVLWPMIISIYIFFYPIFQESRKYLTPLPQYSHEEIASAYNRVYLALLFLVIGYGMIVTFDMWVGYYIRHKIKDINGRVVSVKASPSSEPRFEEGWG